DKVLAYKKKGGLGISSFFALNRALLLKWVWRFLCQDGSLWLHVICAIYGPRLESCSFCINSTWGSILYESQALALKGFDFLSYCKLQVGNGMNTRFWLDTWILDMPLRVCFPRIYDLDSIKEVSVAAKFGDPSLDDSFCRQVRDGSERQQWLDLVSMFDAASLSSYLDRW
nr:RNA-directed DNA polymerase, eukaryota, reverse transcriptase zinc-binding domain protein [Tanacetum cinerariifolium]